MRVLAKIQKENQRLDPAYVNATGKTCVSPQDQKTGKNLKQTTKQSLPMFCFYQEMVS